MKLARFIFLCIVFLLAAWKVKAQEEKYFLAGISLSPTLSASTLIHNSVSVFARSDKNEFSLGLDFYLDKIRGIGCAYQRHFLTEGKKNTWFGELNLRYVKYGSGYAADEPINYFDSGSVCDDNLVTQNSVLAGSLNLGREFFLSNIFSFHLSLGAGASSWKKERFDCWKLAFNDNPEEAIHLDLILKLGFGINVYRKVKQ